MAGRYASSAPASFSIAALASLHDGVFIYTRKGPSSHTLHKSTFEKCPFIPGDAFSVTSLISLRAMSPSVLIHSW